MRIRAYYWQYDVPLMRRIVGPLSVLANRGSQASYSYLAPDSLGGLAGANYDVVLLPNWALRQGEELPAIRGTYLYDLSDPQLLEQDGVQRCLSRCGGALVPTTALQMLTKRFQSNVAVAPSYVHAEWLLSGAIARPPRPVAFLLAVREEDWRPLIAPLTQWLTVCPEAMLLTEETAIVKELPAGRCIPIQVAIADYPKLVRSCYLLLLPGEKPGRDAVPAYEFGYFGGVTLAGVGYTGLDVGLICSSPDQWAHRLVGLTDDDTKRARYSRAAQLLAKEASAARGTDAWLRTVTKLARKAPVNSYQNSSF